MVRAIREMSPTLIDGAHRATDPDLDVSPDQIVALIKKTRNQMREAAKNMEFEEAARLRDQVRELEEKRLKMGG